MWTTEESRKSTATKEQIWALWADVPNWNIWDAEVETSELLDNSKQKQKEF